MSKRPPIWLLPNLLSLDAPLVAVVWMWLLVRATGLQYIEGVSYWVLAAAVWCVYVIDRIQDVKKGKHTIQGEMPWRHRFHWKYRRWLIAAVLLIAAWCLYTAFFVLSVTLFSVGVVGGVLVVVYAVVAKHDHSDVAYAKNFVAGFTFAYGVAAPVIAASEPLPVILPDVVHPFAVEVSGNWVQGLFRSGATFLLLVFRTLGIVLLSAPVLMFGLLCVANITAIDLWERSRKSDNVELKQESELALSMGLLVIIAGCVMALSFFADEQNAILYYVVMASAGLLHVINRVRSYFSIDALRLMVDLALILPVPVVIWLF